MRGTPLLIIALVASAFGSACPASSSSTAPSRGPPPQASTSNFATSSSSGGRFNSSSSSSSGFGPSSSSSSGGLNCPAGCFPNFNGDRCLDSATVEPSLYCDGGGTGSSGAPWGSTIADAPGDGHAVDVSVDPTGQIAVVASVTGDVTFAGNTYPAFGDSDVLLARYSAQGEALWARRYGNAGMQRAVAVAMHRVEGVVLAFETSGGVTEGVTIPEGDDGAVVVVRITPEGTVAWARIIRGAGEQHATALHVHGDEITVVGHADIEVSTPGFNELTQGQDAFVLRLDQDGELLWGGLLTGEGEQVIHDVYADSFSGLTVVGHFSQELRAGGHVSISAGSLDAFAARLGSGMQPQWIRTWGDGGAQVANALVVDESGRAYVLGDVTGVVDFGVGETQPHGDVDIFVARLTTNGATAWASRLGSASATLFSSSLTFLENHLLVGTECHGGVALNAFTHEAEAADICLLRLDEVGALISGRALTGPGNQRITAMTHDAFGEPLIVGGVRGAVVLPSGTLVAADGEDAFISRGQ